MTNAEQVHEAEKFVRALLGDRDAALSRAWVTLWTWPDRKARWLPAHDVGAIASSVAGLAATRGVDAVYIGIGVQGDPDEKTERHPQGRRNGKLGEDGKLVETRGIADDVIGLLGLGTDIDIAGPAHTDKHAYPPDVASARRVLDSMGLPPTLVVDSGHGLQPWWVFTEPWIFGQVGQDDDGAPIVDPDKVAADRARAADLLWSWTTTMRVNARTIGGWRIDPTGDIARVLRPAGTANRKIDGDPRRVTVLDHAPETTYDPDDFVLYILDPKVLATMRLSGTPEATGALEGVDVHAVWARVNSAAYREFRHYPPWLRDSIELDKDLDGSSRIEETFLGKRKDLGDDQSSYDASLARLLADLDALDAEMIVEAVMCRRIRSGIKIDKVDPRKRADYLTGTVGRFIVESERKREEVATRASAVDTTFDRAVEAAQTRQGPPEIPSPDTLPTPASAVEGLPDESPAADEPPTERVVEPVAVAAGDPVVHRNVVDEPSDGGTGRPIGEVPVPTPVETVMLKKVTAMLGLPEGFAVWRAEFRHGGKNDEARLWVMRGDGTADIVGMDSWAVGKASVTRWHAKSAWEKGGEITGHLRRDLHLFCARPAKEWMGEGLPLFYEVFHEVHVGTPREALRAAIRDFLLVNPPVAGVANARDFGHPWLISDPEHSPPVVCLPAQLLRRHMVQMGEATPPTPEEVTTMASALGCQVRSGIAVVEDHRTVRDSRTWLTIAPGLLDDAEWDDVRRGIAEYRESQKGGGNVVPFKRNAG